MTLAPQTEIAALETFAPCCARCGRLLWWSPEAQLIDSRGKTRCPAPLWRRLLVVEQHTIEPSFGADLVRMVLRTVLTGTGLYFSAILASTVVSIWY